MSYYDSDYGMDYETIDRENQERQAFMEEQFWWLAAREMQDDQLTKQPDYPGRQSWYAELSNFAETMRHRTSRIVPCKFNLGYATLTGKLDLNNGNAYVLHDGKYQLAVDLPSQISIDILDSKRTLHLVDMFYGTVKEYRLYTSTVSSAVENLEKAKKLPELARI